MRLGSKPAQPVAPLANIGPRGAKRRRRLGLLALGVAVAAAAALRQVGAAPWVAALLLPLYWGAGLGVFQAQAKT